MHDTEIKGFKDVTELAEAIGDLRYDVLAKLFQELSKKVLKDALLDEGRGRIVLSRKLSYLAEDLNLMTYKVGKIWVLCKPFMEEEDA